MTDDMAAAVVVAVARNPHYGFGKPTQEAIRLIAGLGVEGDVHAGLTDRHRYHRRKDPNRPNLRQVHLIHAELHEALNRDGFDIAARQMGENITTRGLDLMALPAGTRLRLGAQAVVAVTGLREPCIKLNRFRKGLMAAVTARDAERHRVFRAGIMGVVVANGVVRPGDAISAEPPPPPHRPLDIV